MTDKIKLHVLRPMMLAGNRCEPGEILTVDAAVAADLIGTKVELLDPADHELVLAARRREVANTMREAGRASLQSPGSPWMPANFH